MTNINIEKLFDKYLNITTADNKKFKIEKKYIYINDTSSYYGQEYIIDLGKSNTKNIYILKEIYSLEDNRLRYCYEKYINVKLVNTIEKLNDNSEKSLLVIEKYDKIDTLIGSIGNIKKIDSDKLENMENKRKDNSKILRLILKPIEDRKNKKEDLSAS